MQVNPEIQKENQAACSSPATRVSRLSKASRELALLALT